MYACGVDLQPPRLPTSTMRACARTCARTRRSTRSSTSTTSASRNARTARSVRSSGSPGPAPTSSTRRACALERSHCAVSCADARARATRRASSGRHDPHSVPQRSASPRARTGSAVVKALGIASSIARSGTPWHWQTIAPRGTDGDRRLRAAANQRDAKRADVGPVEREVPEPALASQVADELRGDDASRFGDDDARAAAACVLVANPARRNAEGFVDRRDPLRIQPVAGTDAQQDDRPRAVVECNDRRPDAGGCRTHAFAQRDRIVAGGSPPHRLEPERCALDADGRVLELGLPRIRIACRRRELVHAALIAFADQRRAAPVHRQERLAARLRARCLDRHGDRPAPRRDQCPFAFRKAGVRDVGRMKRKPRLGRVPGQRERATGPAHAMPLVAQASGRQPDRVMRIDTIRDGHERCRHEACAAVRRREAPVLVKPRASLRRAGRVRPLLRTVALERRVVEAADVEITADREAAMLVEHRLDVRIVEPRCLARRATSAGAARNRRRSPSPRALHRAVRRLRERG